MPWRLSAFLDAGLPSGFVVSKCQSVADCERHAVCATLWANRARLWADSAQTIGPEPTIFFNDLRQSTYGYAVSYSFCRHSGSRCASFSHREDALTRVLSIPTVPCAYWPLWCERCHPWSLADPPWHSRCLATPSKLFRRTKRRFCASIRRVHPLPCGPRRIAPLAARFRACQDPSCRRYGTSGPCGDCFRTGLGVCP